MNRFAPCLLAVTVLLASSVAFADPPAPAPAPAPKAAPAAAPKPATPVTGHYTSEIGDLYLWVSPSGGLAWLHYDASFEPVPNVPHECGCTSKAHPVQGGWSFENGDGHLVIAGATATLSGQMVMCCGANWPGDTLKRKGGLPTCTVTSAKASFEDDAGTVRKAYVVHGDAVHVLPAPGESTLFAVYHGAKVDTTGFLESSDLACPKGDK